MSSTLARTGPVSMKSIVWAGLGAGMVFMLLEMILVPVFMGGSPWGPPRMIAAILMGREVLPPPGSFDIGIVSVAMIIHFMMSLAYAWVFAVMAKGWTMGKTVLLGAAFGLLLYVVNFYGFTALFPWFADARNWISILAHIVFGVVLGWLYAVCARRAMVTPAAIDVTPSHHGNAS